MLNRLFKYLMGIYLGKPNWLSKRFFEWRDSTSDESRIQFKKNMANQGEFFDVPGAGEIFLSNSPHWSTGRSVGFDIGISWGHYGFTGGVLGRDEAKRMAEFILQKCSEVTETESEERLRLDIERDKRRKKYLEKLTNIPPPVTT